MPLRTKYKNLDDNYLGPGIERFLRAEFEARGITALAGNYTCDGEFGECDLVVETSHTIIFFEIKKKPLTRLARAGSDAHLMVDLAQSLLAAQVQAGWHEVRLRRHRFLELNDRGTKRTLRIEGREVERVAVSLMDYGSFQDRIFLEQFLQGIMGAKFSVSVSSLTEKFDQMNNSISQLARQVEILNKDRDGPRRPFFHCWFLSVPQILIILDNVFDAESLKKAFWATRHIATSQSDFYFDYAYMRDLRLRARAESSDSDKRIPS